MILINRSENNPFFNIAAEEYALKAFDEDVFMLWINSPSVIIGKHQIATAEADIVYTFNHNIPVIRRISGGGTVYHDEGNLNYSLLSNGKDGQLVDYAKYSGTVIRALGKHGVVASLQGKSNLVVDGKKFSGNAEHVFRQRVLHHGTLLFDSDLVALRKCIRPAHSGYTDRSIRSADSHIRNLSEHLPEKMNMQQFRDTLVEQVKEDFPGISEQHFSTQDRKAIQELIENKYASMEWNFEYSPKYELIKEFKLGEELIKLEMRCEKGKIKQVAFYKGDQAAYTELARTLSNELHHPGSISEALKKNHFAEKHSGIDLHELMNGLF